MGVLVPGLAALVVVAALVGLRPGPAPSVLASPSPAPAVTTPRASDDGAVDTDVGEKVEDRAFDHDGNPVAIVGR